MVLKSRLPAPDWGAGENEDREAKCRKFPLPKNHEVNADTDPWFYDPEEAVHICNGTYDGKVCPFRTRCLHISLVNNDQVGAFGGLIPIQRRWVRKNIPRDEWEDLDISRVPSVEYFEWLAQQEPEQDEDEEEDEPDEAEVDGLTEEFL